MMKRALLSMSVLLCGCTEAEGSSLEIRRGLPKGHCGYSSISISPNGRFVVLSNDTYQFLDRPFQSGPSSALVLSQSPDGEFINSFMLNGLDAIKIPFWNQNVGYVRIGKKRLVGLDFSSATPVQGDSIEIDPSAWSTNFHSKIDVDSKVVLEKINSHFNNRSPSRSILNVFYGYHIVSAEVEHQDSLHIKMFVNGGLQNVGPIASYVYYPEILNDSEKSQILGLGQISEGRPEFMERPLLDAGNKKVIGSFSRKSIKTPYSYFNTKGQLYPKFDGLSSYIKDVAIDNDKNLYILYQKAKGNYVYNSKTDIETYICKNSLDIVSPPFDSENTKIHNLRHLADYNFSYETIDPKIQYNAQFFKGKSESSNIIIYFHGGPNGVFQPDGLQSMASRLGVVDSDWLIPEYAGSVGSGFEHSLLLKSKGISALEKEAESLSKWIKLKGYKNVFVISASFGSVPAAVFAVQQGIGNSRGAFIAPLIRFPTSRETTSDSFGPVGKKVSTDGQKNFEDEVLGANTKYDIEKLMSTLLQDKTMENYIFIFGSLDKRSNINNFPVSKKNNYVLIPNMTHDFILSSEKTWSEVSDFYENR